MLRTMIRGLLAVALLVVPTWFSAVPRTPVELQAAGLAVPPPIDIRRAPWYEWMLLPDIGEARARRIVAWRERCGGFSSFEDMTLSPT